MKFVNPRSAFVFNFEIYSAGPNVSNKRWDLEKRLMKPLMKKGYWVYWNSYYTFKDLVSDLAANGFMLLGTVQKNRRSLPKELMSLALAKGEPRYQGKGPIVVLKRKDKREVALLTACLDPRHKLWQRLQERVWNLPSWQTTQTTWQELISDQFLLYVPLNRHSHAFPDTRHPPKRYSTQKAAAINRPVISLHEQFHRLAHERTYNKAHGQPVWPILTTY